MDIYRKYGKRGIDVTASAFGLLLLSPLLAVVALLVRWKLGSPVLFRQQRPGLHGQPFMLVKFRTMTDQRDANGQLLPDAVRLTTFGKFMRKTSLDELPELWNVLKGEMSLVGPRPLLMEYLPYYTEHERRRHDVRPGITGLAQVNGRTASTWESRFEWDIRYVVNLTLWTDVVIIMKTARRVISRSDIVASAPQGAFHVYRRQQVCKKAKTPNRLHYVRRLDITDLPCRVAWFNSPEVYSQVPLDGEITLSSTKRWFKRIVRNPDRADFVFLLSDGMQDDPVAMAGLVEINRQHSRAQLYIVVAPQSLNQGYGSKALQWLCNYGFTHYDLEKLFLYTLENNVAARRFYKKHGFIAEGVLRSHHLHAGIRKDRYIQGLLRQEWMKQTWHCSETNVTSVWHTGGLLNLSAAAQAFTSGK